MTNIKFSLLRLIDEKEEQLESLREQLFRAKSSLDEAKSEQESKKLDSETKIQVCYNTMQFVISEI